MENSKSKIGAGLLGIFLGSLGVHNFYLGYIGKAIGQLATTLILQIGVWSMFILGTLTAFIGIGFIFYIIEFIIVPLCFIPTIWGLVEGILILCGKINTDKKGNPLV
ncbi:MAG: TM2 domain-containing protein [Lachnospiraceae bacterium]|nr:TM2 domain-containing protein [Lachnospiraceae bacterium]